MRCAFVGDHKTKLHNKNQHPSSILMGFIAFLNFKYKDNTFFRRYDPFWSGRFWSHRCETQWKRSPSLALQDKSIRVQIGSFKVLDEGPRNLYLPYIHHFRSYPSIWSSQFSLERHQTCWRCGPGPALQHKSIRVQIGSFKV